jgi:hypothetical protein
MATSEGNNEAFWERVWTWLAQSFGSRYVRLLEEEVGRLRAENRALVNSLLGTAGIPPIEVLEAVKKAPEIPRVRRRSWHQIQALREIEEATKAKTAKVVAVKVKANGESFDN